MEECLHCYNEGCKHCDHVKPSADDSQPLNDLLTAREVELINGMIEVQQNHAARCVAIQNRKMAVKQKGWDLERVALLEKVLRVMGS